MPMIYQPGPQDPRESAQSARWADRCIALIRTDAARNTLDGYQLLLNEDHAKALAHQRARN